MIEVLEPGALTTIQDRGRFGYAHLGVPRAGAADQPAAATANRLLGNDRDAAVLETLLGGLVIRATVPRWFAVTGASVPVTLDSRPVAWGRAVRVPAGGVLALGTPVAGLRTYVAVGGGVDVDPVLGSRATDTLSWVGPPRVEAGQLLPVGPDRAPVAADAMPPARVGDLRVEAGPHPDWFAADGLAQLCSATYTVAVDSDRIGVRLDGPVIQRRPGELPSAGMVAGAIQVPPNGQPVIFTVDHPTTGGYPVIGVLAAACLSGCAQLRPGDVVRFTAG